MMLYTHVCTHILSNLTVRCQMRRTSLQFSGFKRYLTHFVDSIEDNIYETVVFVLCLYAIFLCYFGLLSDDSNLGLYHLLLTPSHGS